LIVITARWEPAELRVWSQKSVVRVPLHVFVVAEIAAVAGTAGRRVRATAPINPAAVIFSFMVAPEFEFQGIYTLGYNA
jgi:hypothetical protein